MKKYLRFSIIIALVCAVFACKDNEKMPLPDPILSVAETDKSLTFSSEAGNKTISISANREVRVISSKKWCTPTVTLNTDKSAAISVVVDKNEVSAKRRATVIITTKSAEQGDKLTFLEIPVEQAYPDPFVTVAEADKKVTLTSAADDKTIAVNTNREVEAKSSETWCIPTVIVNADKSVSLHIAVLAHTTYPVRTATIAITTKTIDADDKTTSLLISVEQDLPDPIITVAEADKIQSFMSDVEAKTITVSANREVWVAASEKWCTPTLTANSNVSSSLHIAVDQNSLPTKRTAFVTITTKPAKTDDKTTSAVISVEQEPSGVQIIDKSVWTIESYSSFWVGTLEPEKTIDGNPGTFWHTDPGQPMPQWFIVNFSKPFKISGILLTNSANGTEVPKHVTFEASNDLVSWTTILEIDELPKVLTEQRLPCDNIIKGQYLRFTVHNTWSGGTWTYLSEISIY